MLPPQFPQNSIERTAPVRVFNSNKMATDICLRRLTKELKALQKDPMQSPRITVMPNEANILEMHVCLTIQ